MDAYHQEIEKWRRALDINLKKENSWLALAGLFWLNEGQNSFGAEPSNTIVLPPASGPDRVGVFLLDDGQVTIEVRDEVDLVIDGEIIKTAILKPDASGSPTEITLKNLTLMLIEREDGLGIRLWDNHRPEREKFPGRRWFPVREEYRIKGSYQAYAGDLDVMLSRINGSDFQDQVQGQINFTLEGRDLTLLAFEQEEGSLFTLFLDQTCGRECYPAGRYLVLDPPQGEIVEIDFNRAYNPPCAFTDFATCPLPPVQNRLDLEILAGEKYGMKAMELVL